MAEMIFVLVGYQIHEGHGAPLQAFMDREEAERALALINLTSDSGGHRIYAVPVWPNLQDTRWPDPLTVSTDTTDE